MRLAGLRFDLETVNHDRLISTYLSYTYFADSNVTELVQPVFCIEHLHLYFRFVVR